MKSKSVFETLSKINVNDKVEKKNGLTYLSWAWAWAEVKKHYPNSTYTIYENAEGLNFHHDGKTAWVKTGVTIEDIEHIEYLPVLDFRNASITLDKITSFNVNSSIQRSLTKAIARHGLGLYIYAGEDIPQGQKQLKAEPVTDTHYTLDIGDENWEKVLSYVVSNKQLGIEKLVSNLEQKYKIKASVKKELKKQIS
jgi:hypothetical protein